MTPRWYYRKGDQEFGPITAKDLRTLAETRTLSIDDLVKFGDHETWLPARLVAGIFRSTSSNQTITMP